MSGAPTTGDTPTEPTKATFIRFTEGVCPAGGTNELVEGLVNVGDLTACTSCGDEHAADDVMQVDVVDVKYV